MKENLKPYVYKQSKIIRSAKCEGSRSEGERREMIQSYKDLMVYQKSYELALLVHKMTQDFPLHEKYELASQLRRATTSIPLNIAEGYAKRSYEKDFKRALIIALGSCNEVLVILDMVQDLGYIEEVQHQELTEEYDHLARQLNVLAAKWK